jgi:hypothetical protein
MIFCVAFRSHVVGRLPQQRPDSPSESTDLKAKLQSQHHLSSVARARDLSEPGIGLGTIGGEIRYGVHGVELSMVEGVERLPAKFQSSLLAPQVELLEQRQVMAVEAR